jgi:hypothetical protein
MERTFEQQGYLYSTVYFSFPDLAISSWLWMSDDAVMSEQKGVFRVNCIDCLDRTNVVQVSTVPLLLLLKPCLARPLYKSAFARHMLNRQLGAVALLNPMEDSRTEADVVVNDGIYVQSYFPYALS